MRPTLQRGGGHVLTVEVLAEHRHLDATASRSQSPIDNATFW
jgi:hypothetical protein